MTSGTPRSLPPAPSPSARDPSIAWKCAQHSARKESNGVYAAEVRICGELILMQRPETSNPRMQAKLRRHFEEILRLAKRADLEKNGGLHAKGPKNFPVKIGADGFGQSCIERFIEKGFLAGDSPSGWGFRLQCMLWTRASQSRCQIADSRYQKYQKSDCRHQLQASQVSFFLPKL